MDVRTQNVSFIAKRKLSLGLFVVPDFGVISRKRAEYCFESTVSERELTEPH